MVKVNLILTDYLTGKKTNCNDEKLKAANTIKELLGQIDFKAEMVPENNQEMFVRLLTSLKGEPLNVYENEVVDEIVNY
jgi:hypothetical protein